MARYLIKASPVGGSGSISFNSTSTTLDISGLNVCQYNYSVNVSTITAGGVWSGVSSSVTFTADLSGTFIATLIHKLEYVLYM